MIAYGGDHVIRNVDVCRESEILREYEVLEKEYAVSICRIEPENNCHITLEAFERCGKRLLFVGNWNRNDYGRELKRKYANCKNIEMIDSVYDLDVLYVLRKNAGWYMHGHSAGGTNPSLVEAMFFGRPIVAYDVVYNRETTGEKALYFKTADDICELLSYEDLNCEDLRLLAEERYRWQKIAREYEAVY